MKNIAFAFLFLCIFISCKSEYEQNPEKMKETCQSYLKDKAFKENQTMEFFEFTPIEYITKDENYIDTIKSNRCYDKIEYYDKLIEYQLDLLKSKARQAQLYNGMLGFNHNISKMTREDVKDLEKEGKEYIDSMRYYIAQDSLIQLRIANRKSPKPVYLYKGFIKATSKDNNSDKTENMADTIYYLFDSELKMVNL